MAEKLYVKVEVDWDTQGYVHPRAIEWYDGRMFWIDDILEFHDASPHQIFGIRRTYFTVSIRGMTKRLYNECGSLPANMPMLRWYLLV